MSVEEIPTHTNESSENAEVVGLGPTAKKLIGVFLPLTTAVIDNEMLRLKTSQDTKSGVKVNVLPVITTLAADAMLLKTVYDFGVTFPDTHEKVIAMLGLYLGRQAVSKALIMLTDKASNFLTDIMVKRQEST